MTIEVYLGRFDLDKSSMPVWYVGSGRVCGRVWREREREKEGKRREQ